jgi:uncharacterized protein (DUF305 family)
MTLTVAAFILVSASACGVSDITSNAKNLLPSGAPTSISASDSEASLNISPAESMFLQMMIPHHEQAIQIAETAASQTQNQAILDLAARISAAQQPEIDQMKNLLSEAGLPLKMDHSMGMDGMLPESEIEKLSEIKDSDYDTLFLSAMILHHEGAIAMTKPMLDSSNSELRLLAEKIIADQTGEIAEMKALLEIL